MHEGYRAALVGGAASQRARAGARTTGLVGSTQPSPTVSVRRCVPSWRGFRKSRILWRRTLGIFFFPIIFNCWEIPAAEVSLMVSLPTTRLVGGRDRGRGVGRRVGDVALLH